MPAPEEGKRAAGLLIEKPTGLAALNFAQKHLTHLWALFAAQVTSERGNPKAGPACNDIPEEAGRPWSGLYDFIE